MTSVGIILPHLKAFGGVRRFLEVGRELELRGYAVTFYVTTPGELDWFDPNYFPRIKNPKGVDGDIVLVGDPPSFNYLEDYDSRYNGGSVYVWVIAGGHFEKHYRGLYEMCFKSRSYVKFLINNPVFQGTYPAARLCVGGVNTKFFHPRPSRKRKLWVGYYAGRGHIKGENTIVEQLRGLDDVELIAIKGLDSQALRETYWSLDYFVTWEQREGWCNMAAEALACGVPVVTNGTNCEPFKERVIVTENLRDFFQAPMAKFSWPRVVDRLEEIWREDGAGNQ